LPLTVIVAENVNSIALPRPAMELGEKLPSLSLGNLWFWRSLSQWTVSIETDKTRRIGNSRIAALNLRLKREQPAVLLLPMNLVLVLVLVLVLDFGL